MADKFLGTYNPTDVSLIVSGLTMSGFFDGTFITIARADNEIYKTHIGAYGEVARTKNNNTSGMITFTLKKTSPSNVQMDLLKLSPVAFPTMVRNDSDPSHIAVASSSWVNVDPDIEYDVEETGVEWIIMCADLIMSHL